MAGKPGSQPRKRNPRGHGRKSQIGNPGDKEILYGYHSVFEALKAGRRKFESIMVYENRSDKRVQAVADLAGEKTSDGENPLPVKTWTGWPDLAVTRALLPGCRPFRSNPSLRCLNRLKPGQIRFLF